MPRLLKKLGVNVPVSDNVLSAVEVATLCQVAQMPLPAPIPKDKLARSVILGALFFAYDNYVSGRPLLAM